MRPLHEGGAKEKYGKIGLIEAKNAANSQLLVRF
jgi:hypothetical protein